MDPNNPAFFLVGFCVSCLVVAGLLGLLAVTRPKTRARLKLHHANAATITPTQRHQVGYHREVPPTTHQSPAPPPEPTSLVWAELRRYLVNAVHLLVVGQSTGGKSTATMAIIGERAASDLLVIFNPHQRLGDYADLPQLRTYDVINAAMLHLLDELERRKEQAATSGGDYPPLTIVVEEAPDLMAKNKLTRQPNCPAASHFFGVMARQGAKYKMRLIGVTQSTQVATLGIEGEKDVLENFRMLVLGEMAIDENPDAATQERPAVLLYRRQAFLADVGPALELSRRRISPDCMYRFPVLVDGPVRAEPDREPAEPAGTGTSGPSKAVPLPSCGELVTIFKMLDNGDSNNRIAAALGGNRQTRMDQIRTIKAALESVEDED